MKHTSSIVSVNTDSLTLTGHSPIFGQIKSALRWYCKIWIEHNWNFCLYILKVLIECKKI